MMPAKAIGADYFNCKEYQEDYPMLFNLTLTTPYAAFINTNVMGPTWLVPAK